MNPAATRMMKQQTCSLNMDLAATRRMKQATDLQLEHLSCYYAHLWCLILLVLLPLLSVAVTNFFASTQWDSPWYGMLQLLCFQTGASLQEKGKSFCQAKEKTMQMTSHLEAKKFEIRKRFCKSEVQNQLWWASLQSGSDPQWTPMEESQLWSCMTPKQVRNDVMKVCWKFCSHEIMVWRYVSKEKRHV